MSIALGTVVIQMNSDGTANVSITGASITEADGTVIQLPTLSAVNQKVIPAPVVVVPAPPTGTLTITQSSQTEPATVTLTVVPVAGPGATIASVVFQGNGITATPITKAPYSISEPGVPAGSYVVSAVITDNHGLTTTLPAQTLVVKSAAPQTPAPTISLSGTTTGVAPATATLTATASAASGATLSSVQFFSNGVSVGTDTKAPYTLSVPSLTTGTYVFTAVATDSLGQSTTSNSVSDVVTSGSVTPPPPPVSGAPLVLYTNLASGPNSGGENNLGTYLSVFGKNFGNDPSKVQVFVGDHEVDNYRYLGTSLGRSDVQQISTQLGSIGSPTLGTALPVRVVVNGVSSNADITFTPNPGRMLFVDNVKGNDTTAVPGDITKPYRHVQVSSTTGASAYAAWKPGDIIVMRQGEWTDQGNGGYFMKFINVNGTAPTGVSGTGPLTLMAYPTEVVQINLPFSSKAAGGISGVDATAFTGGKWFTICDIHIEAGGNSGVIDPQIAADHWRIVNNELTAATATNTAKAAGITGNGTNQFWVGNHIHNIAGGSNQEMHAIYIDGDGSYEIAYNVIEDVTGGNGFQTYNAGTSGPSTTTSNINFHHNIVHDISKHGLNIADGTLNNVRLWDNIVYNTQYAGIRFNTNQLNGFKFYNNTVYNTNLSKNGNYGALTNDWNFPKTAVDIQNNIICPTNGTLYAGGSVGFGGTIGTIANNLCFGGKGTALGTNAVSANPNFVNAAAGDFHLAVNSPALGKGSSAVSSIVVTDYDTNVIVAPYDIGALQG